MPSGPPTSQILSGEEAGPGVQQDPLEKSTEETPTTHYPHLAVQQSRGSWARRPCSSLVPTVGGPLGELPGQGGLHMPAHNHGPHVMESVPWGRPSSANSSNTLQLQSASAQKKPTEETTDSFCSGHLHLYA